MTPWAASASLVPSNQSEPDREGGEKSLALHRETSYELCQQSAQAINA